MNKKLYMCVLNIQYKKYKEEVLSWKLKLNIVIILRKEILK